MELVIVFRKPARILFGIALNLEMGLGEIHLNNTESSQSLNMVYLFFIYLDFFFFFFFTKSLSDIFLAISLVPPLLKVVLMLFVNYHAGLDYYPTCKLRA